MTHTDEEDFGPGTRRDEQEPLLSLATRLETERPVPSPDFRHSMRRQLTDRVDTARLTQTRRLAALCAGSGVALLLLAATGVAGVGPLAAG